MYSLTLNLSPIFQLTEAQFEELALVNRDVRLERTAKGDLTIMPPTGGETGKRNLDLEGQLRSTLILESSTGSRYRF